MGWTCSPHCSTLSIPGPGRGAGPPSPPCGEESCPLPLQTLPEAPVPSTTGQLTEHSSCADVASVQSTCLTPRAHAPGSPTHAAQGPSASPEHAACIQMLLRHPGREEPVGSSVLVQLAFWAPPPEWMEGTCIPSCRLSILSPTSPLRLYPAVPSNT